MSGAAAVLVGAAPLACAFIISVLMTPLVRRWFLAGGFVDHPSDNEGHKQHTQPMPLGGGVVITLAFCLPVVAILILAHSPLGAMDSLQERFPHWPFWMGGIADKTPTALAVLGGVVAMHTLGLMDDNRPLPAGVKLAVQFAVALMLTVGFELRAADHLGVLPSIVITTLWIVIVTNAFNFMDNMDGLSAGVAGLTALILGFTAFSAGQVFVPCMLMLIAGAVLGFLVYNFPPAKIFLGEGGSLVVGYLLAVATVLTTYIYKDQQRTPFGVLVPVVVFAVPLYDFATVVIDRLRRGVSIFKADRRHFSHRLVELGLTRTQAVLTIYLATTATSLTAILLPLVGWAGAALVLGQCVCVIAIIAILESRRNG